MKLDEAKELQIAQLTTEAARLSAAEKDARAAIADANARAEQDRLARVKIEARLAWRTLEQEQRQRIISEANKFAGQEYALSVSADPEALNFLDVVDGILQEAGWVRIQPFGDLVTVNSRAAVGLKTGPITFQAAPTKAESDLKIVVLSMAAAFNREGIAAAAAVNPEVEKRPSAIEVVIASKPLQ